MCTVGLWRYSRHPNYFGEGNRVNDVTIFALVVLTSRCAALCWWGIWSMATACYDANVDGRLFYISVLSPVYVCFILLFLSGVPTLEGPWDKKYGHDAGEWRHQSPARAV